MDVLYRELVGLLHQDRFSFLKVEALASGLDEHTLVDSADQGVLHATLVWLDIAMVEELVQIELASELAVETG